MLEKPHYVKMMTNDQKRTNLSWMKNYFKNLSSAYFLYKIEYLISYNESEMDDSREKTNSTTQVAASSITSPSEPLSEQQLHPTEHLAASNSSAPTELKWSKTQNNYTIVQNSDNNVMGIPGDAKRVIEPFMVQGLQTIVAVILEP